MRKIKNLFNVKKIGIALSAFLGVFAMIKVASNAQNDILDDSSASVFSSEETFLSSNIKYIKNSSGEITISTEETGFSTRENILEKLQTQESSVVKDDVVSGATLGEYKSISIPSNSKISYTEVPKLSLGQNQFQGVVMSFNVNNGWMVIKKNKSTETISFSIDPIYTTFINSNGEVSDFSDLSVGKNVKVTISENKKLEPYETLIVEFLN
ncbi:MAG: hypothetical protein Fur0024_0020 [Patescibacteria group bacterium]